MKMCANDVIFQFGKENKPVLTVKPGTTIDVETLDCFSNQLREESDTLEKLDWERVNPATGSIYVEGAEKGDTLKVTINKIELDEKGTVCCAEGEGTLGHLLKGSKLHVVPIKDGFCQYLDRAPIPLRKMIGVIGVAPEDGNVNTGTPGRHGGNMDNSMITEGTTVYFPVAHEGALLALGDIHSVMGDGEIGVSGLETPAVVNLTIELIKGRQEEYPVQETENDFGVIVSKSTVDEAVVGATELMCKFLEERIDLDRADIVMLMSLVGDLQVCQVVDPEKTMRFIFPKKYMDRPVF